MAGKSLHRENGSGRTQAENGPAAHKWANMSARSEGFRQEEKMSWEMRDRSDESKGGMGMEHRKGELTERQKRFADYYLETGNASRAAVMAGYSKNYAPAVKKQPAVEMYLHERLGQLDAERVAGMEEVLEYLTKVMRGEMEEEGKRGEKGAAARMKAAELLGKRLGLFADGGAQRPEPVLVVDDVPESAEETGEAADETRC